MHVELSISSQIANIESLRQKDYLWTMDSHGLEMGVGKAGRYAAHAHRHVVDVMFAPAGIHCGEPGSAKRVSGSMLIALPGTWFGPIVTGDFFFAKFYCDERHIGVPDKVVDRRLLEEAAAMSAKGLIVAQGTAATLLPFFRPGRRPDASSGIDIRLGENILSCRFGEAETLLVAG